MKSTTMNAHPLRRLTQKELRAKLPAMRGLNFNYVLTTINRIEADRAAAKQRDADEAKRLARHRDDSELFRSLPAMCDAIERNFVYSSAMSSEKLTIGAAVGTLRLFWFQLMGAKATAERIKAEAANAVS